MLIRYEFQKPKRAIRNRTRKDRKDLQLGSWLQSRPAKSFYPNRHKFAVRFGVTTIRAPMGSLLVQALPTASKMFETIGNART